MNRTPMLRFDADGNIVADTDHGVIMVVRRSQRANSFGAEAADNQSANDQDTDAARDESARATLAEH